jgi:hypothetical protein
MTRLIDNPGLIGVTQPRRVATVSMAKRVGEELNLSEDEVSYQVSRFQTPPPPTLALTKSANSQPSLSDIDSLRRHCVQKHSYQVHDRWCALAGTL